MIRSLRLTNQNKSNRRRYRLAAPIVPAYPARCRSGAACNIGRRTTREARLREKLVAIRTTGERIATRLRGSKSLGRRKTSAAVTTPQHTEESSPSNLTVGRIGEGPNGGPLPLACGLVLWRMNMTGNACWRAGTRQCEHGDQDALPACAAFAIRLAGAWGRDSRSRLRACRWGGSHS